MDTLGLLLVVVVTAADLSDRAGAPLVAGYLRGRFSRLRTLFADAGYGGAPLTEWMRNFGGWVLEIVRGIKGQDGFVVQPKRWIVERAFGWLNWYRRLSKDYERRMSTSEGMVYLASTRRMWRWLNHHHKPT